MVVNNNTMIKISNKTERFMIPIICLSAAGGVSVFSLWLMPNLIAVILSASFGTGILLLVLLSYIVNKSCPWYLPHAYRVVDCELWHSPYYEDGDKFKKYNLSLVKKIKFNNRKRKWIQIWFNNGDTIYEIFTAPMIEKCNEQWQQLFEEIRKCLPSEAQIIVK